MTYWIEYVDGRTEEVESITSPWPCRVCGNCNGAQWYSDLDQTLCEDCLEEWLTKTGGYYVK